MSSRRSYRDALTGDRNEFIGTPVMSGGAGGASGAPEPGRDENRKPSDKKVKSSSKKIKSPGQKAAKSESASAPASAVAKTGPKKVSGKYRGFKSSGKVGKHRKRSQSSGSEAPVTGEQRLSDSMEDATSHGHNEVSQELAASQVNPSCSHDRDSVAAARDDVGQLSGSFERFSVDDDMVDGNTPDRSLPSSPTRSPEVASRILLPRHVNPLRVEERPAFVEYGC